MGFLIQLHPLTNFEIQKVSYLFSRDNLPKKNKGWRLCNKTLMNTKMKEHIGLRN